MASKFITGGGKNKSLMIRKNVVSSQHLKNKYNKDGEIKEQVFEVKTNRKPVEALSRPKQTSHEAREIELSPEGKIILPKEKKILVPVSSQKFKDSAKNFAQSLFSDKGIEKHLSQFKAGDLPLDQVPDDFDPQALISDESEFDMVKLLKKSIDPHTGLPLDVKIPEGDFKEAANYFDFCSNFMGKDSRFPFSRQMWVLLTLFAEICPKCSDPRWNSFYSVPVDYDARAIEEHLQLLRHGKCPKCKGTKSEFIKQGKLNSYLELNAEAGQRSGKSNGIAAPGAAYLTHKYLKYPKMSSICVGIQDSTPLTATFVGYRFADAFALAWEPITNIISESPWFQQYHQMLADEGKKIGVEFMRFKDVYLRYSHRNLELYPAGPNKRALRGRTRFLTLIDELGWFPLEDDNSDRERAGAEEVYTALDRSLLTVRQEVANLFKKGYNNFIPGIAINISSPSSQMDKIHRLAAENVGSKRCLALPTVPTWEINPLIPRDSEVIVDAYRKDPEAAERDYGANPPLNDKSFKDVSDLKEIFKLKNRAGIDTQNKEHNGKTYIAGEATNMVPMNPIMPAILSLDAGLTNNSFAITVMSFDRVSTDLLVHVALEIQPLAKTTLHYNRIYLKVILPIIDNFNVRYVFADRWNSAALLHRIEEERPEVQAIQHSVKYKDFILVRSLLQENKLLLPQLEMPYEQVRNVSDYPAYFKDSPAAHLMFQMSTVRDKANTVIKGGSYTDDIFRALVLGASRAYDPKIKDDLEKLGLRYSRVGGNIGAIAVGRSQGTPGVAVQNSISHVSQGLPKPSPMSGIVVRVSRY